MNTNLKNTHIEQSQVPTYSPSISDKPSPSIVLKGDFGRVIHISFEAGQQVPAHKHPNSDVIVQVLAGELEHTMNTTTTLLSEKQIVHFSGDNEVGLRNPSDVPAEILVTMINRES